MKQYIQIEFQNISVEQSDLLLAALSEIGFEGFEEEVNSLKAFIPAADFDEAGIKEIAARNNLSFNQTIIGETNWNAVWESNFQPVLVDDFVAVRADFHEPIAGVKHEVIITPKMSFGTGHHATTFMMLRQMRLLDFNNKKVVDFGTGTGVLAILAEKMGAAEITGIDYDDWSIENATENCQHNQCSRIRLHQSDNAAGIEKADIILANINKNVILDNLAHLKNALNDGGVLLLSGLLITDEEDIVNAAKPLSLRLTGKEVKNNWICLAMGS